MASKPPIHIYTLSRLAFAHATDFRRIIKELQAGRRAMFWSYKPLRQGAYAILGKDAEAQQKVHEMVANLAAQAGGEKCRKANLSALRVFEQRFLPSIKSGKANLMEDSEKGAGVDFGPCRLIGGPHFSIVDVRDENRYVYLHPSDCEEGQVDAFCELLTIVLEEKFKAIPRDLWFLDLRNGIRVNWPASKKLVRRKCREAAELLLAIQSTNLEEGEA